MTNGSVLYHRHDSIVTLTLNRPETLNAMNEAMMGEMERILIELEADTAVRAVVLTGLDGRSRPAAIRSVAARARRRSSRAISVERSSSA
jgi:enoyl-CoA hydratase/carnithine racemase